jgi:hypothetical protein
VPLPPGARLLLALPGLEKSGLLFRSIAIRSRVRASCRASAEHAKCAHPFAATVMN